MTDDAIILNEAALRALAGTAPVPQQRRAAPPARPPRTESPPPTPRRRPPAPPLIALAVRTLILAAATATMAALIARRSATVLPTLLWTVLAVPFAYFAAPLGGPRAPLRRAALLAPWALWLAYGALYHDTEWRHEAAWALARGAVLLALAAGDVAGPAAARPWLAAAAALVAVAAPQHDALVGRAPLLLLPPRLALFVALSAPGSGAAARALWPLFVPLPLLAAGAAATAVMVALRGTD